MQNDGRVRRLAVLQGRLKANLLSGAYRRVIQTMPEPVNNL